MADIVAMPSRSETLSRVQLKAQACGKVLLASDIPASREVVEHGETGLLHRLGDIDGLAAKTVLAAADVNLRAMIGKAARRSVERHQLEKVSRRYSEALLRVAQVKA